ncbi:MAG: hypothetical protein ACI8YQ_004102 [Polaribacter sp.]|jgi:hypothetical protein
MKNLYVYLLLFSFGLIENVNLSAQEVSEFQSVIGQISELENKKDPKCHATASRLEDFIYGTPLSFEARSKRIAFQKAYVKMLWLDFTKQKNNQKDEGDDLALFKEVEQKYFEYTADQQGIQLVFLNQHQLLIPERDYRQYSSIAYALRAILSVQQANIFESESLASLDAAVMAYFKKSVDLVVLALLHESDQLARKDNEFQISAIHIDKATKKLFNNLKPVIPNISSGQAVDQKGFLYKIIDQKQAAYQAYNQISQGVFLRNIQVYFAKVLWPTDPNGSKKLTNFYTEFMVQYSSDLLAFAEVKAIQQNKSTIEYKEIYEAVQVYLPHTINQFEDVTYFPNLDLSEQIVIEAYDLDAFRDSGLHWQYLKYALDDRKSDLNVAPDPFALELLVEGIAQFAVVIFRMAGSNAKKNGAERMEQQYMTNALKAFQQKLNAHQNVQTSANNNSIVSGQSTKKENAGAPFSEISDAFDLDFQHRNSDWLGRAIRGYVLKEEEGIARLSIPPAFGGGGVAAEDIDNDGWVDVLLLGGRGNRLYRNDKGKELLDITAESGIDWKRPDGNYGEPRQPIILDFDNDGWQDIFISYVNDTHRIYRNKGDGTFEDMTLQANLGGAGEVAGPATSIDYDKDGLADIYIGYFGNYLKGELPTLKRHNTNGGKNKLFRNLGNFKFEEVSEGSGLQNAGWTQAVGHSDINGDGWQDLIVGNDFGVNAYYLNNQDGTFTDSSKGMGTDKPSYTMNIGISDLNQDMRPDFYISNIVVMEKDDKYVMPNEDTKAHFDPASLASMRVVEANDLFISESDNKGGVSFSKSTAIGRGYSATGWSWDADFFDYDNDGDDDLYCLTGMNQYSVYGTTNEYYSSPEGESKNVVYAASNTEANLLFKNENGALEVVTNSGGLDYSGTSRSAAFFDMDNDGDQDIIVNDYQNKARLFLNNSERLSNNWIAIKLVGDPTQNITKDAVGTALILTTPNGEIKWKEVYSTTGYLSVHPKTTYFGLNKSKDCTLEIRWPNGHIQKVKNLEPNKTHVIHYNK